MITIEVSGGGILFTFTGNQHYLYDGSIEVPVNSLSLVVDESEMFTFYKAASNDIFLSGRYADLGWSKEQLVEFYKNNMVANGGGSSITEIYVGTSADTVDPSTGEVHKEEGKKEWLCIVYKSEQGVYSLTKVNLNEFIIEGEFASGVTSIEDGTVVGVVDPRQDKVVLTYNSGGTSATTDIVLSVNESGFTVNHIQEAIDAKVKIDREIYTPISGNYITSAHSIVFNSKYDDELFEVIMPDAKPISGINGVEVVSGETLDIISGVVDDESDIVVTKWNDDGTSATTDDVLSVSEDGFKVEHIQDAIDAKHANTIKLNGYTSGLTEDLFDITSGNTITEAFMKIENKLYKDNKTGIIFDESSDDITILSAGTYE